MKKHTRIGLFVLIITLMLFLCSCSLQNDPMSIYGKWKSTDGDLMQLNEDGTYWMSGYWSEEGRYSKDSRVLPLETGDREYQLLWFHPNDFSRPAYALYYVLNNGSLEMSMGVNKHDGSFDADDVLIYVKQ